MAALAKDVQYKFADPRRSFDLRQAAVKVYQGALVGDNGSGFARPLAAGDPFLGFADERVDNSGGSAGDLRTPLIRAGKARVSVSGAAQAKIGDPVYASDDNTFTFTQGSNSFIGRVVEFDSGSYVWVEFDAGRGGMGQIAELTDSSGGSADGTVAAVSGSGADSDINNNFAELTAKVNAILRMIE